MLQDLRHDFCFFIGVMPSTVIADFSYDATRQILKIIYRSGMVYEYEAVPEDIYNAMKASFSKGTFLNTQIKGKYRYRKVE